MDSQTRRPLTAAFTVVSLFVLSLTAAGAYLLLSGIQTVEEAVTQNMRKSDLISDMRIAARFRALTLSQMLLMDDPFDREDEYNRFNAFGTDYIIARNALDTVTLNKQEREIFDEAGTLANKIGLVQIKIVEHIQAERFDEAIALQVKASIPFQRKTDELFDQLQDLQRKKATLAIEDSAEGFRGSLYVLLSMALFVFIAIIFVGRFAVKRTIDSEQGIQVRQSELEKMVQQRTAELVQAKELAEQASQTKTDFLSQMSHELRTPLNAILGFSQILQFDVDKRLSDEQLSQALEIQTAGTYLLELINELLDMAQIESGNVDLNIEVVSLYDVVNESIKMILPLAEEREITVVNSVTESVPTVLADKLRLKQSLLNILGNAVKYNYEKGSVLVDVQVTDKGFAKILIKDTGTGISDENKTRVFNEFERLSSHAGIEGSGIGLSVTRHLVNLMNGRIGVENTVDDGCTFWIELPIK